MTTAVRRPETARLSDTAWHVITAIVAVVGVVAAALGALIEYAPVNGTITIFDWTWNVSSLSELWAPFLMIGGGVAAALSMGIEAVRDWDGDASPWLVGMELLVAVAGITALVIGVVLLF